MRTMSLKQLLEIIRAHPGTLPQAIATHLLCASVWRAALSGLSLRSGVVVLDAGGGLLLDPAAQPATTAPSDAGYVAPEVIAGAAPANDPRALVYAAGALGYQLLTTEPPPLAPVSPRPELADAVGEIVRTALAADPGRRFASLTEMSRALHSVHPAPAPDVERHLLAAVFALCSRWGADDSAVGQLRVAAERIESGQAKPSLAQVMRWMRSADVALEDLQRRHLDLMLTLASREAMGVVPVRAAEGEERAARLEEHVELLQRIATFASPSPPAPPPPPAPRRLPWLRWAGPVAASAVVALVVTLLVAPRRPEIAPARPVPDAAALGPSASAGRSITASPIVLAMPQAKGQADSREGPAVAAAPPARRAPLPRAMPAPKPVSARAPASSGRDLVESGERALREGRAQDALTAFNLALAAEPDLAPAMRGAAIAYAMQQRNREAKEHFERYLQLAPGAEDAAEVRKVAESLAAAASN